MKELSVLVICFAIVLTVTSCTKKNIEILESKPKLTTQISTKSVDELKQSSEQPNGLADECKGFIKTLEQSGYRYGWVKSAENPSDHNSLKLDIFYYTKITAEQEPIIFYYGGPLGIDRSGYKELPPLLEGSNLAFVFMDQRGTGCSSPVPTEQTVESLMRASNYGSTGIVEDSEILRKFLFGEGKKWKIFGQSYGGHVVSRYILNYPRSIVKAYSFGTSYNNNFTDFYQYRIKAQALVLEAFAKARPKAYQKFLAARELATDSDCIITNGKQKVCGKVLFDAYFLLLREENRYDRMEVQFSEVLTFDGKINLESIKKTAESSFDYFFSPKYIAAQALIRQEIMTDPLDKRKHCRQGLLNLYSEGFDFSKIILNECRIVNLAYRQELLDLFENTFPQIPAKPIKADDVVSSLEKTDGLLFHLYSAGKDAFSPEESLNSIQTKSEKIIYRFLPKQDHWGFFYSEDFKKDLQH